MYAIMHGNLPAAIRLVLGYKNMVAARNAADALSLGNSANTIQQDEVRGLLQTIVGNDKGQQLLPFGDKFLSSNSQHVRDFLVLMRANAARVVGRYG